MNDWDFSARGEGGRAELKCRVIIIVIVAVIIAGLIVVNIVVDSRVLELPPNATGKY